MADSGLQSPKNPHFFQALLPGFDSYLNIPVTFFLKHLQGRNEHETVKLRTEVSDTIWEVKIEDGRRLTTDGWKEFVTAHDFRIGDVIVFRHEGDFVFHVTALGLNCCEIEYTSSSHSIDDDCDIHQDNIEIRPMKKRVKKNPRREDDSSSEHSCFVANVSVSNLQEDKVYVPLSFVRSNGWTKACGKVVLLNEMGRSWNLSLDHDKSGIKTYLRHGWRSFCNANGMNRGGYTFKLVKNSGTPVIRLCQAGCKPDAESSSNCSYFAGSLTPSSFNHDALYLPKGFVSSNGLDKDCCDEMVLKNEYGRTWNLVLRHHKSNNTVVMSRGWRSFCQGNGLKARDSFRFKLVRTGAKPVLCLCPAETKRDTRVVECSEGTDVDSLSTDPSSGEESSETEESEVKKNTKHKGRDNINFKEDSEVESIEDKISLHECSNIEKWKYCSRSGASSSSSQSRFLTLTISPYSYRTNKLRLPLHFTRVNGIKKPGKITLLGQDGVHRMVRLVKDHENGRLRLGRDWKGFCELHSVKIGESFVLELIWKKDASPALKFCTKVNCV
ncbi:PREDICTED: B3 domain-containing protein REM17-like [Camelina sativa]|uniref:B3 domain-containing protein REM17-like n=1 Tax=Camelina sativa TaxID=90675 RepID=A0ABM0UWW3_CAMSA|nr:PREDICTED: B3 domain-containing protein REM17-like [Camelina sativa]XP_019089532.1 PREDICTED: B3 domain-containing protein REM17-like [Camelina sativa]